MRPLTASLSAVGTMLAAGGLAAGGASRVLVVHVVFAAGVVPLIFAAILHFVPVLTRTGAPSRWLGVVPAIATGVGWSLAASMAGWLPFNALAVLALFDAALAGTLLGWIITRARNTVGKAHPGYRWYVASLATLAMAMLAISATAILPESFLILRSAHLHLNVLGFIGVAAFGTLPVLLPTALGVGDPGAASWLARSVLRFAGACLLIAGSAAVGVARPGIVADGLALAGFLLLSMVVLSLPRHWQSTLRVTSRLQSATGLSLVAAVGGFQLVLVFGMVHALGILEAGSTVPAFMGLFLLPLFTGALTQLLPVWRFPGPDSQARMRMAAGMARFATIRVACFQVGGLLFAAGTDGFALATLGTGMALFVTATISSLTVSQAAGG